MLQGNPARNIFGGINIAASGELGVGVGEEERGSGEREVLEGLVGRIEGLVDLVVSKFGTEGTSPDSKEGKNAHPPSWLGTGQEHAAEDGAVFLGTGALSNRSVRDVTHWMEDLYQWGEHAYGIIESPTSTRRAQARRRSNKSANEQPAAGDDTTAAEGSPKAAQPEADAGQGTTTRAMSDEEAQPKQQETQAQADEPPPEAAEEGKTKDEAEDNKFDKMFSYMKLGYGSYWTLPGQAGNPTAQPSGETPSDSAGSSSLAKAKETASPPAAAPPSRPKLPRMGSSAEAAGHYLIGLKGEIEEQLEDTSAHESDESDVEHNSRTVLRTLNVELSANRDSKPDYTVIQDLGHPNTDTAQSQDTEKMFPGYNAHDVNQAEKLRVVVYVNRPFMFVFLFRLRTDSLAWDSLYRSLHYQLAPLKKPLLSSTSYRPETPETSASGAKGPSAASSTIYNLVWDPTALTVRSSIPNIPDLQYLSSSSSSAEDLAWSRADAVNTHLHLLNIHSATRSRSSDLERTQKTNRGWWIVWTRLVERSDDSTTTHHNLTSSIHESSTSGIPSPLPPSPTLSEEEGNTNNNNTTTGSIDDDYQQQHVTNEIFLIRRASDHAGFRSISVGEGSTAEGASKLVQGIGVDTRRYVEELLSFL